MPGTDVIVTGIVTTQVVASGVVPPAHVDEPPQLTPEIQAEVDRLAGIKAKQLKREEFDEETKKAEEKATYWRKEKAKARTDFFTGERREAPPPRVEVAPSETVLTPPKREDFEDYDAYVEAVADHRADVKIAKWVADEAKKSGQTETEKRINDLSTKIDEGYILYPDFEDVAKDPTVPITMLVRDILAEIDHPADVAYYLGKNRTEAIKIAHMTPFRAHAEILRIEAEAVRARPNPSVNPHKVVSGAPPPIKPGGSHEVIGKDPNKMTQKEYEAWTKEKGMRQF